MFWFFVFCGLQGRRGRPGSSGRRGSCGLRGSSLSSGVVAVVGGRRGSWGSLEVVMVVVMCLMLFYIFGFFCFVSCRLVAVVGGHCRRRGSSGPLPSSGVVAVVAGSCVLSSFSGCCSVLMLFCVSFACFIVYRVVSTVGGRCRRRGSSGSSARRLEG